MSPSCCKQMRARDEPEHVGFPAPTLWTLARVQESPLDKIYVLLMIFIGPLAQGGGKLPRNLKESCFRLEVRMQRVIKFRKAQWKPRHIYPGTMSPSNLTILISFAHFCFLRLEYCVSSGSPTWGNYFHSRGKCCFTHLCVCVFVYTARLHNVMEWLIRSTALFLLLNKWSLIFLMEFQAYCLSYIKFRLCTLQKLYNLSFQR